MAKNKVSLGNDFNLQSFSSDFKTKTLDDRILMAHEEFDGGLVLLSSFGVQAILLLHYTKELGLDIPVVSVDIEGSQHDAQRAYRDMLYKNLKFVLHLAHAKDEGGKKAALDHKLEEVGATAYLSGARAAQTDHRKTLKIVDQKSEGEIVRIHPVHDWPDQKADYYVQRTPRALQHPEAGDGVRSHGGVILASGEIKTECGIHL